MHPRRLRCSSLKYSRYSRSSRLAGGAPRPSRCDARLSPRAVKGRLSYTNVPTPNRTANRDSRHFGVKMRPRKHETTKARKHESTKARKHESTKARKHEGRIGLLRVFVSS